MNVGLLRFEVVQTILHSRASATRKFSVLNFLQQRFIIELTPTTLKVYVHGVLTYHMDRLKETRLWCVSSMEP